MIGTVVGDAVVKYGKDAVAAGLRKLGFDNLAEKLLRNTDEVVDNTPQALVGPGHTNPAGFTYTSDLMPNDPRIIQKQSTLNETYPQSQFVSETSLETVPIPFAQRDFFLKCEGCTRRLLENGDMLMTFGKKVGPQVLIDNRHYWK